jgi:AraC-like DNA-binding protein
MQFSIQDPNTGSWLRLHGGEKKFNRLFFSRDQDNKLFTIAWNKGGSQVATIDGDAVTVPGNSLLPLMFNQSFEFEHPESIVAWQFNREFYCIIDHDAEVSCVGFLFGRGDRVLIPLDETASKKMHLLHDMFIEEFNTSDGIQNEMLLVLLKRLIIFITKLAKTEFVPDVKYQDERLDIFRQFNLLVEANYHKEHTVNFYAQCLNKSPKTLSNLFAIYNQKTPLQMIQDRIVIEAKRLLTYTNKSTKEITHTLGFEDSAYFCNFFKRHTTLTPLAFRANQEPA